MKKAKLHSAYISFDLFASRCERKTNALCSVGSFYHKTVNQLTRSMPTDLTERSYRFAKYITQSAPRHLISFENCIKGVLKSFFTLILSDDLELLKLMKLENTHIFVIENTKPIFETCTKVLIFALLTIQNYYFMLSKSLRVTF